MSKLETYAVLRRERGTFNEMSAVLFLGSRDECISHVIGPKRDSIAYRQGVSALTGESLVLWAGNFGYYIRPVEEISVDWLRRVAGAESSR